MKTREEIERETSSLASKTNYGHEQIIELLLDIRDLLTPEEE